MTEEKFVSPSPLPTPHERELLVVLAEECAEVQQRVAKTLRFGRDEVQPGQPLNNAQRLADEMGDLVAMLDACVEAGLMPMPRILASRRARVAELAKYLQTSPGPTECR